VSHDRDFLDPTVSKILAFEGDGDVQGYIGGYSDYLSQKKEDEKIKQEKIARAKEVQVIVESPKPTTKLSFKVQYELDNLPAKIEALEKEIDELSRALEDTTLYARDAVLFQKYSERLTAAEHEKEAA
jgi:ATP-binding cassette subfamily F protein uup